MAGGHLPFSANLQHMGTGAMSAALNWRDMRPQRLSQFEDNSCKKCEKEKEMESRNTNKEENSAFLAVYLENPDGSLSLGLPPGTKLPEAPDSPRQERNESNMGWSSSANFRGSHRLLPDLLTAYKKHEKAFTCLLLIELVLEATYIFLLYHSAHHSVNEVSSVYKVLPLSSLWLIFWMLFALEMSYLKLYFWMGFTALLKHKPKMYSWFGNIALIGIVFQVFFSYMNRANLVVFALRLVCYIYARFMRSLLQTMQLRPMSMEEEV
eukprot:TRINITY_DN36216_c0_g1_i4.p1 TRINITY_DN36216_c0_g1~~TRINITY_DN36216_c0_g1_i4.p1  ORF type:complete len:266 (-),score=30.31 TRINITY_DN36216_c0_g1_i4:129-926(-)